MILQSQYDTGLITVDAEWDGSQQAIMDQSGRLVETV